MHTLTSSYQVVENQYGKCVVASEDIPAGKVVERFDGPVMKYEDVPDEEACYAACQSDGLCMIPMTSARYLNHSCNPNCFIDANGDVITKRLVREGEELTFDYVTLSRAAFEQNPEAYFWDPRWTFTCLCGAANCYGKIDRYMIKD